MSRKPIIGLFALFVAFAGMLSTGQVQAANPLNGAKIYNMHCSNCHGPRGRGAMPGTPDFSRSQSLLFADAELVRKIEQGSGVMPAYRGLLTIQDIHDVIAHLRTFQ